MEITFTDTKKKQLWKLAASLPGVKYGAAHYKYLEQNKTNVLKVSKRCFDAMMILSLQSITDVQW